MFAEFYTPAVCGSAAVAQCVAGQNGVSAAAADFAATDPVAAKHVKFETAAGAAAAAPAKAKAGAAKSVDAGAAAPAKAKPGKPGAAKLIAKPAKVGKPGGRSKKSAAVKQAGKKPAPKPNANKPVAKPSAKPAAKPHGRGRPPPPAAAYASLPSAGPGFSADEETARAVSRLKTEATQIKAREDALFALSAAKPPVGEQEMGRFVRAASELQDEALIVAGAKRAAERNELPPEQWSEPERDELPPEQWPEPERDQQPPEQWP